MKGGGVGTKLWLRYGESGEQVLCADPPHRLTPRYVPFEMSYVYQHSLLQDRLDIFFDRKRGGGPQQEDLFCSFDLNRAMFGVPLHSTRHLCGQDSYDGELTISDRQAWKLRYSVSGPGKAYIIETEYKRLGIPCE